MTVAIEYDKKKVIQALRYHFISQKDIRIAMIAVNVMAVVLFVLFMLGYLSPANYITFSLLWLVLMLCYWFLFPYYTYKTTVMFKHQYMMGFNEDNFSLEHERMGKTWEWKAVDKYMESPHFFYLYFNKKTFLLVPKDGCKDSDEVYALRQLIKGKVKKG